MLGYSSTAETRASLNLTFPNKETAVKFCERNGMDYEVEEKPELNRWYKSYESKFKWKGLPKKPEDDI